MLENEYAVALFECLDMTTMDRGEVRNKQRSALLVKQAASRGIHV